MTAPRVYTRHGLAASAADRWMAHYLRSGSWYDEQKRAIHEALVALGPAPNADDVERVIGNTSWTQHWCDACGCMRYLVVEVGQEPDYESSTASLCETCLMAAVDAVRQAKEKQ